MANYARTAHRGSFLLKLIAENVAQPTDELMWGTPGTALASVIYVGMDE